MSETAREYIVIEEIISHLSWFVKNDELLAILFTVKLYDQSNIFKYFQRSCIVSCFDKY